MNQKQFVLLLLLVLFVGCSTPPLKTQSVSRIHTEDQADASFGVIDAHLHARFLGTPERNSKIPMTREELFQEFKDAGVVGAVSHTAEGGENYQPNLQKDSIVQCYGVGEEIPLKTIEAGLKSKKYGCIKIYLGYVHRFAYSKEYRRVYDLAQKYDVPVVFHTGDTYSAQAKLKYSDPLTIDEVAVDYPKVTFVIAHCGNPWIESAAEVGYKNPNVYLEGSAFMIGDLSKYSHEQLDRLVVKPLTWIFEFLDDPNKLMFGTDWPLTRIGPYLEVFKRAIPKEHWRKVFHDNAARVFGLK